MFILVNPQPQTIAGLQLLKSDVIGSALSHNCRKSVQPFNNQFFFFFWITNVSIFRRYSRNLELLLFFFSSKLSNNAQNLQTTKLFCFGSLKWCQSRIFIILNKFCLYLRQLERLLMFLQDVSPKATNVI